MTATTATTARTAVNDQLLDELRGLAAHDDSPLAAAFGRLDTALSDAGGPVPTPWQPGAVSDVIFWVLVIEHQYGHTVDIVHSEAQAHARVAGWARHYWYDVAGRGDCPQNAPADDETVVDMYFENAYGESYTIESAVVRRPNSPQRSR